MALLSNAAFSEDTHRTGRKSKPTLYTFKADTPAITKCLPQVKGIVKVRG
jgi:hypothetical protein